MTSVVEGLVQAANPGLAEAALNAGAAIPNLAGLAASSLAAAHAEVLNTLTTEVVGIVQGAGAKISGLISQKDAMLKAVDGLDEQLGKLRQASLYFSETNNLFPLRKLVGIPTSTDVLSRHPDIDKIPQGWTPAATPAAAPAPAPEPAAA